jgi:hypothetical protein
MIPRTRMCVVLAGACVVLVLATAPAAFPQEPPAPGNLIANWGFDTDTAGWGSFNGTLARTENGSLCSTSNPGAATVTRRTGDVFTISDSQGAGNVPTVRSTVAGESYVAYANVGAATASAVGKPVRIILRERVGDFGPIVKETAASMRLPDVGSAPVIAVSTVAARTGSTLGLRIAQSAAGPGDAFTVDDVFLRRTTQEFGPRNPGTLWTAMPANSVRLTTFTAPIGAPYPDDNTRYLDRLRVYLDGKGGATGSQKLRAVIYAYAGLPDPQWLLAASHEVTIQSGSPGRWVDFRFDGPVRLSGIDGAVYGFGLLSGPRGHVARYAATSRRGALYWGRDTYADGPNLFFGTTDPNGASPDWSKADKAMSIQGVAAPVGEGNPDSCF